MGWRIVYIEESDYVSNYLDNVKIRRTDDEILIPLADIHTLIIDNYKTTLTVNFLIKCSEYNINVVICGLEHLPKAFICSMSGNNQTSFMLKKQINWDNETKQILHQIIIKGKIENQNEVLKKNNKSQEVIEKLNIYKDEVLLGDITNREGLSAKMYFRELFGKKFIRFEDDIINAALNYGYTILRTQISKVLISKGLNTNLGIFHRGNENNFNLSDDIIEVFRPIIDDYVYKSMLEEEAFKREHRINIIKLTTVSMKYNNMTHTFFNVINLYVANILDSIAKNDFSLIEIPLIRNYGI